MARLRRSFYEGRADRVARALLGKRLVRVREGRRLAGVIVETEAYRGTRDPGSHAYRGRKPRNAVMFGDPGHAYLYFTYGNHWMLNLTCEPSQRPAAVLIRALEPSEGVALMKRNRRVEEEVEIASGPGKLAKALGLDGALNGEDVVTSRRLFVEDGLSAGRIGVSSRVGLSEGWERKWRFYIAGNRFVSRGKPSLPRKP
ncbi:MAG: DNA-3-methyladenine glycosylase [archaeon]|nr:MAG: DNA-3-methyladenine glycosylase [archaeon]